MSDLAGKYEALHQQHMNLLVEGDPIANLQLVADPEANFKVIMKDGRIYKNSL